MNVSLALKVNKIMRKITSKVSNFTSTHFLFVTIKKVSTVFERNKGIQVV